MTADLETARAHAEDPVTFDGAACPREKLMAALGGRLDALPEEVKETRRFVLGQVRGLCFGVVKYRFSPPEVFLEGHAERKAQLSRDSQGPRACWNAVERLLSTYETKSDELRRELLLAEGKLRDFEARLGGTFPHERYTEELSALRDELKVALSATPQDGAQPPKTRTAAELADLITALKSAHQVEAVPAKRPGTAARAERPVTARVREKAEAAQVVETLPEPAEGQGGAVEEVPPPARPAAVPPAPKPARHGPPEGRRRRYQKWLF
jgi:hypothetical protein